MEGAGHIGRASLDFRIEPLVVVWLATRAGTSGAGRMVKKKLVGCMVTEATTLATADCTKYRFTARGSPLA